MVSKYNL